MSTTWSHSSLKKFETCARQYHEVSILRNYPQEQTESMLYGTLLHEAAENYIKHGTPLDEGFKFMQPLLDTFKAKPGMKLVEHEMAVKRDLSVCKFDAPDRWVRGIADLVIVNYDNLTATVVDWKSGNDKYPDRDQLILMSLLVFAHFGTVRVVNSGLFFVLKDSVVKHRMEREQAEKHWWDYRERTARLEQAHATGVWNPTQSGLCRRHCVVHSCSFNGVNR